MISKQSFIETIVGKRIEEQRAYISAMRLVNRLLLKPFDKFIKPANPYTYLTICSIEELDRVEASLFSFVKNTSFHPEKYVIVSDGSWDVLEGASFFSKNSLPLLFFRWEDCALAFKDTCPSLMKWAEKQIWGRKLSAILYFSNNTPVLFADSDVLWFDTPINSKDLVSTKLKLSVDNSHNYDAHGIEELKLSHLYDTEEPINCGVVFIHGGLSLLDDVSLSFISYQAEHCGKYSEQTLFALLDLRFNCRWEPEEIVSDIDDIVRDFDLPNIYYSNMMARHYVWRLKWVFWKDYIKIVLNGSF